MSFRVRVLALVSLVAVIAVAATAFLAFRQVNRQVSASMAADQETVLLIVNELANYAREHGTWDGVATAVVALKNRTGQRIQLLNEAKTVLADSDVLDGRAPRAVNVPPIVVNPLPTLALSARFMPATDVAASVITKYRRGIRLAACLTRRGLVAQVAPGEYGVPEYSVSAEDRQQQPETVAACLLESESSAGDVPPEETKRCMEGIAKTPRTFPSIPETSGSKLPPTDGEKEPLDKLGVVVADCLQKVFLRLTADVAPQPLHIYLGAVDDLPPPTLRAGPVVAAAILVAVLAVLGTILLSRRVLRPIETLRTASQRLGEGDLARRVPAKGRDELAQLGHTFNRMADSLQRGEERQRRLVADVAHELRTPLANLRGYLEALKDGVIPPDPALFASLHDEAVLQQRIVDDLQELALAEAGTLAYHRVDVDLAELLETCRTAHLAAAETAGVSLTVQAQSPVIVHADPDRLRQVIGNLVTNALRATPSGGEVTLSVRPPAVVQVRDTGVGIAPDDLPHVFDRFWRADPARGRTTGGSGLGLAIARQIITDHGGTITIESTQAAGTVVTITLTAVTGP